jgi:hypothetical protein
LSPDAGGASLVANPPEMAAKSLDLNRALTFFGYFFVSRQKSNDAKIKYKSFIIINIYIVLYLNLFIFHFKIQRIDHPIICLTSLLFFCLPKRKVAKEKGSPTGSANDRRGLRCF